MGNTTGRGVQSIEVGGRVLRALVETSAPMMLRDLAARAEVPPAQAHAYLLSFRKLGLVEQDETTGRYRLGPFALQLGIARLRSFDPLRMASKAAIDFAADTGMMVAIAVWGTHGPTVIQVQEAADQVHVNVRPGTVFSLTGTASGAVFAAFMPRALIEARVAAELAEGEQRQSVGPPTSAERLAQEIEVVRRQGFAAVEGRPVPGINALSAPVFDQNGQLQLAMTLIGPAGRLATGSDETFAKSLLEFTGRLSVQLGYGPRPPDAPALTTAQHPARRTRSKRA